MPHRPSTQARPGDRQADGDRQAEAAAPQGRSASSAPGRRARRVLQPSASRSSPSRHHVPARHHPSAQGHRQADGSRAIGGGAAGAFGRRPSLGIGRHRARRMSDVPRRAAPSRPGAGRNADARPRPTQLAATDDPMVGRDGTAGKRPTGARCTSVPAATHRWPERPSSGTVRRASGRPSFGEPRRDEHTDRSRRSRKNGSTGKQPSGARRTRPRRNRSAAARTFDRDGTPGKRPAGVRRTPSRRWPQRRSRGTVHRASSHPRTLETDMLTGEQDGSSGEQPPWGSARPRRSDMPAGEGGSGRTVRLACSRPGTGEPGPAGTRRWPQRCSGGTVRRSSGRPGFGEPPEWTRRPMPAGAGRSGSSGPGPGESQPGRGRWPGEWQWGLVGIRVAGARPR
jgi:hypothetical protein